jgi:hypothetical protein
MVVGQTAGMRVWDIMPDKDLVCTNNHVSSTGYYSGCDGSYILYIDTPYSDRFLFSYYDVECGGVGYRMHRNDAGWYGDIEVLADTFYTGNHYAPPYFYGDTIFTDDNSKLDFSVAFIPDTAPPYGYLDTSYFMNHYAWFDTTTPNSYLSFSWWSYCLGGSPNSGWMEYPDTVMYLVFRKVIQTDTLYGWVEAEVVSAQLRFTRFALGGGTGNFIYSNVPSVENLPEVSLFPNPVSNVLRVECAWPDFRWQVLSVDGKQLMSAPTKVGQIDLQQLTSGVYLLRISNNVHSVIKRFIKE